MLFKRSCLDDLVIPFKFLYLWLDKVYWRDNCVWSPSYFISSDGIDEETVKKYIVFQG